MEDLNDSRFSLFFSGLDAGLRTYKDVRQSYNRQMAFDFSPIDFFYPNENKVSEILAFFLKRDETHGQGDAFLKRFLQLYAPKGLLAYESNVVHVKTEQSTEERRRIDIVISIGHDLYAIGIENKVGAKDQNAQLADYAKDLGEKYKDYVLIYLNPTGDEPSEDSISQVDREILEEMGHFVILSYYQDIIQLLIEFEGICKADNVRAFIKNFNKHLTNRFIGGSIMSETKFLSDYLEKNPTHLQIATEIAVAPTSMLVLALALKAFNREIHSYYKDRDYTIETNDNIDEVYKGNKDLSLFSIRKNSWTHIKVSFEFAETWGSKLIYGLNWIHDENNSDDEKNKRGEDLLCKYSTRLKEDCNIHNEEVYWGLWNEFQCPPGKNIWTAMVKDAGQSKSQLMEMIVPIVGSIITAVEKVS